MAVPEGMALRHSRSRWADSARVDELVAAYEAAGGRAIDRDTLRWWLVAKTFTWGVGCMLQADTTCRDACARWSLAAVGRRAAEQEWDLIELLDPEACAAALAAPSRGDATRRRRPVRATDRARAARRRARVPDRTRRARAGPRARLRGAVAANVLAIVERELAQEPVDHDGDDWDTLALIVRDRLAVASPKHLSLPPTLRTG